MPELPQKPESRSSFPGLPNRCKPGYLRPKASAGLLKEGNAPRAGHQGRTRAGSKRLVPGGVGALDADKGRECQPGGGQERADGKRAMRSGEQGLAQRGAFGQAAIGQQ